MQRLIKWLKSWRTEKQMLNAMENKIHRVLRLKAQSDQNIAKSTAKIEKLENELNTEVAQLRIYLNQAEETNRKLSEALDAARDELETCREITIPGLVAANTTFASAWDSTTAQNAMMQAATHQRQSE